MTTHWCGTGVTISFVVFCLHYCFDYIKDICKLDLRLKNYTPKLWNWGWVGVKSHKCFNEEKNVIFIWHI